MNTERPDYVELQRRLGRTNLQMGEAIGLTGSSWANVRAGRQWTDEIPPNRVAALNALLAEAGMATIKVNGTARKGNGADHADDAFRRDSPPLHEQHDGGEVHRRRKAAKRAPRARKSAPAPADASVHDYHADAQVPHPDEHHHDEDDDHGADQPETGPKPPHLELIDRLQRLQAEGQDITTEWRRILVREYPGFQPEQIDLIVAAVAKATGITRGTLRKALDAEREAHAKEQWEAMQRHAEANRPPPVDEQEVRETKRTKLAQACAEILSAPDVLALMEESIADLGVTGEHNIVRMTYLCLTTRLFEKVASLKVHGPSSSGKSYTTETVLKLFPADSHIVLSAGSERSLIYSDKDFAHRFVVLLEATPLQKTDENDMFSYIVRSLLSEGRIIYETVVAGDGGVPRGVTIEKSGPTGLLVTTTATRLHAENETRLLSVTTDDSKEQTRRILQSIAEADDRPVVGVNAWHDFQRWLELGPKEVAIPYGGILADMVDVSMVRMRRDFTSLLAMIRAHAVIDQNHRERDERGRIVADLLDYAGVRDLIEAMVAFEIGADVSSDERRLVEEVIKLVDAEYFRQAKERQARDRYEPRSRYDDEEAGGYIPEPTADDLRRIKVEVSQRHLAKLLEREQPSVSRWTADAIRHGYLINHNAGFKGKSMLLSLDLELPGKGRAVLPTVEQLEEAMRAK